MEIAIDWKEYPETTAYRGMSSKEIKEKVNDETYKYFFEMIDDFPFVDDSETQEIPF